MKTKKSIYLSAAALLFMGACSPDEHSLSQADLQPEDLVQGVAYSVSVDADNTVTLTSLLDKSKVNMTVKGKESQTKLKSGRLTFIVKAGKNDIDPKSVFGVFQFEVKKKTREFVLAEGSLLGGIQSTTSFNTVPTQVKKYGTESYLVVIENAEPGQYAFTTTDISYVSTFGVE